MIIILPDHIIHFHTPEGLDNRTCCIFKNDPVSEWGWIRTPTRVSDFHHNPWSCKLVELVDWRDVLHYILPVVKFVPGVVEIGVVHQLISMAINVILIAIREGEFIRSIFRVERSTSIAIRRRYSWSIQTLNSASVAASAGA